ncbi:hypothetical protein HK105_202678 [Polyrhizophydium stewartii]|uniref:Uncharacterized protein n=1 Tax=Polyrhizophydium stewartii TaxID=2732419 RepID=A0ABR4NE73_9FUNG
MDAPATMLDSGLLPQWRAVVLAVLPPPMCLLRIGIKDKSDAEFVPLSTLTAMRNHKDDATLGGRMCEMRFGKRRIAKAWADMVARCALATSEPAPTVGDDQTVVSLTARRA